MKSNWLTKKLGEVCEIVTGSTPRTSISDYYGGDILWAGPTDLDQGDYVIDTQKKLTQRGITEGGARLVPKNSVMVSCIGNIGKVAIASEEMATNQQINTFFPKIKDLDSKYLFYALVFKSDEFRKLSSQTTLPIINKTKCSNIEIPLPPLSEQKKIVAKLERVLAKISEAKKLRAEARENADNLLPAELHKIFYQQSSYSLIRANKRIVKKWEEKELGEVFVLNYGKGLSRSERSENGKYIVYGANGELGRSDKYLIEGDGIIIGRKGSAGEITCASGKYWPTDVTYFVTEDKKYDIGFAYYLFKFLNFPQYAVGVKPGINRNQIYEIKIPLPSLAEQKKIVGRLDSLSEKIGSLRQAQAKTQNDFIALEQSVLSKSFHD